MENNNPLNLYASLDIPVQSINLGDTHTLQVINDGRNCGEVLNISVSVLFTFMNPAIILNHTKIFVGVSTPL